MVVIFTAQAIASSLRFYLFTTAGERIVARLRSDLYRRLVIQEIGFFDQRTTGELMSRLAADTGVLQNAVSVNVSMGLRYTVMALGGILFLFYISPVLTALMLAVVPPVALGAVIYGRPVRALSLKSQDALAEAGKIAEETLGSIRTVRAFTKEEAEADRYRAAIEASYAVARIRIKHVAYFTGAASAAGYCAVALVLWYGGRLVVAGSMSPGELTSFILYTLTVAFSIGALGDLFTDFMRAAGATGRVFGLLDRGPSMELSARCRERAAGQGRPRAPRKRTHHAGHRAPPFDGRGRGSRRCGVRWQDCPAWNPRRFDGASAQACTGPWSSINSSPRRIALRSEPWELPSVG